jgi:hypothetical protein
MKQKLFYSIILLLPTFGFAQDGKFKILPFINVATSVKDGQLEAGPEFNLKKTAAGREFVIRPTFRMPLTSKSENVLQIDRFSSDFRGILAIQGLKDKTKESGNIKRLTTTGQIEYGSSVFKFYPTGTKANELKIKESSYAFELKHIRSSTKGMNGGKQSSLQFRLRYSYDWKAANEVGVVNLPNINGVIATTNLVIDPPSVKPTFSPAFSWQIYPGKGNFSYSPTVYYDFTGKRGEDNLFDNLNRVRIESWVFYYPIIPDNPNVKITNIKIGITPFFSIRTTGTDDFNTFEYGVVIRIKFDTTFFQFF